jgi:hypothetical protein
VAGAAEAGQAGQVEEVSTERAAVRLGSLDGGPRLAERDKAASCVAQAGVCPRRHGGQPRAARRADVTGCAVLGFLKKPKGGCWVAGVGRHDALGCQCPGGQVGRIRIVGRLYRHFEIGQGLGRFPQVEREVTGEPSQVPGAHGQAAA